LLPEGQGFGRIYGVTLSINTNADTVPQMAARQKVYGGSKISVI